MSGFNDFMDKAGAFAFKAAEKAKDLASAAATKTKQASRVARLNMDISSKRDAIKKSYAELGRLYYEARRDAPDELFAQVCQDIDLANASIASLEAEIAQIKAEMAENGDAEDADFETVVDETEAAADVEDVEVEIEVEQPAPEGPAPEEPAAEAPANEAPVDEGPAPEPAQDEEPHWD